jgi:hypothetical protein
MRRRTRWRRGIFGLIAVAAAAAGLVTGRSSALVDWRVVRAVVLESDDWGLCGFVPADAALAGFDARAVEPGVFPEVYWRSTLEDSAQVAALAAVLASVSGADELPAVLQPNYILSSLAWEGDAWVARDLPDVPPAYGRPGLWTAVDQAIAAGVWHPELHGRWHYDPARRRAGAVATPAAREAARRQLLLFPGSEESWELGPWRPDHELRDELDGSLRIFRRLFGRDPAAVIAPDYVWNDRCERLWLDRGLRVIQAKRGQRSPGWQGLAGRARKLADRTWARQVRRDRVYLERNALFEPVQNPAPSPVVRACAAAVAGAWATGAPAIVETHRINFAHLDPAVGAAGREALNDLLQFLGAAEPRPQYLVDDEIAQLQRRGVSVGQRGVRQVWRNLSRSRRLVVSPGQRESVASLAAGQVVVAPPVDR